MAELLARLSLIVIVALASPIMAVIAIEAMAMDMVVMAMDMAVILTALT